MALAEGVGSLSLEQTMHGLKELQRVELIEFDGAARMVRVPMAPMESPPRNARHLTAWLHRWRELPESPLKHRHLASLYEVVVKQAEGNKKAQWVEAWASSFGTVAASYPQPVVKQQSLFDASSLPSSTYPQVETVSENVKDSDSLIKQPVTSEVTPCLIDPDPDPVSVPESESSLGPESDPDPEALSPGPPARAIPAPVPELVLESEKPWTKTAKKAAAFRQVQDCFQEHFVAFTGGEKPSWSGVEAKLLKPFVDNHGAEKVCRHIEVMFTEPPAFVAKDMALGRPPTVKTLVAFFDSFVPTRGPPRNLPTGNGKAKAQTGDEIRAMADEMRKRGVP